MLSPNTILRLSFVSAFLLSTATADTQFSFPSFSRESRAEFFTHRDAAYDATNRSYIINAGARTLASRGSCGTLFWGKAVHIQNVATGRVASFSTSFSFKFTKHSLPWDYSVEASQEIGLGFIFLTSKVPMAILKDKASQSGKVGACRLIPVQTQTDSFTPPCFDVTFETNSNPSVHTEPSNNFIRVGKNLEYEYDLEVYTHNLCGNGTHCSYFSNGRVLTAWIDFDSSSQTLEIRMADGADPKPSHPLLLISNFQFPKALGDDVYLSLWGSSDVHRLEEHELLSWSFSSTEISESRLRMMLHYLKSRTSWVSISAGGALFGTVAASVILWCIFSFATPSTTYTALGSSTAPHVFSYSELLKATQNFDERNLIGRGGSGVVYKGSLEGGGSSGGVLVAVKQINMLEDKQAQALFHAEVASLGQIRHRNVVSLYGWCQEKGKLLLVYEYLPNGTFNDWLHKNGSQKALSLKMRHSILEGMGVALRYLHEDCLTCVLHQDIKSRNVLLDGDFKALIGDFGLARLIDHHKLDKTTLATDPEMLKSFQPSNDFVSDFDEGLQVPGLPSNSSNLNGSNVSGSIVTNVDPKIQTAMVVSLLQLGLFCCLPNPKARPSMEEVNRLLQQIWDIEYESSITTILMLSLPATKPLELYDPLEFSSSAIINNSVAPSPTSLV